MVSPLHAGHLVTAAVQAVLSSLVGLRMAVDPQLSWNAIRVQAVYDTLKALREGVPPRELKNIALFWCVERSAADGCTVRGGQVRTGLAAGGSRFQTSGSA